MMDPVPLPASYTRSAGEPLGADARRGRLAPAWLLGAWVALVACGDTADPRADDAADAAPSDTGTWPDSGPGADTATPPDAAPDARTDTDDGAPLPAWRTPIADWPGALLSVSGTSADDVWVVGAHDGHGATVLHWNGSDWTRHTDVAERSLWWVEARAPDDVWFGGEEGEVLRWDGETFHTHAPPLLARHTVFGLTIDPNGVVHAVGGQGSRGGFVWRFVRSGGGADAWTEAALPADRPRMHHGDTPALFKVAADAAGLWVVGGAGQALYGRWDAPLEGVETDGEETLFTVAVSPDEARVLAVGGGAEAVIHSLRPPAPPTRLPDLPLLQGVAFGPDGTPWVAGARGEIWRERGGAWERANPEMDLPVDSLHAVWVDPDGGVWAVGGNVLGAGLDAGVLVVARADGAREVASPVPPPPPDTVEGCPSPVEIQPGWSVARVWNELTLAAIRRALPEPTVHARNLYHVSIALHDAWAATVDDATGLVLDATLDGARADARAEAMSHAAWTLLVHRYAERTGGVESVACFEVALAELGFGADDTTEAAELGRRIGQAVVDAFADDGSLEELDYHDASWTPSNPSLRIDEPGVDLDDPDLWQPLDLAIAITQNGIPEDAGPQRYIGPHWGGVVPFAMHRAVDDAPPVEAGPGPRTSDAEMGAWVLDVVRHTTWLDLDDGVRIDISPGARGNVPLGEVSGDGHAVNPVTGAPFEPQWVLRGDFGRVLAEHWADGPNSETPPGHWNVLAHRAFDHPAFETRWLGEGEPLERLEWDVRALLVLNGALHDAAIAAWHAKRMHESARPVSLVRWMASLGQRTEPDAPDFDPDGLPLEPGLVERITEASSAPGERHERLRPFVGELAIRTWPGEPARRHERRSAFRWMRAVEWMPYQPRTFVTPAFPGYVSGHSTFSRTAADVLTGLTGTRWVPGGLQEHVAPAGDGLEFEAGPSEEVRLQWATWQDAADQAGESRIWGGIHVSPDDLDGRRLGAALAVRALDWARARFDGAGDRPGVPTALDRDLPPRDDDPPEDRLPFVAGTPPTGSSALTPGTGRSAVVPLWNGDDLVWENGVQGGFHVWVTARLDPEVLAGLDDEARRDVRTRFTLERQDGDALGAVSRQGGYRDDGEGWSLWGNFMILRPGLRPRRLDDEPLRLVTTVELPDGTTLDSTVWVLSRCCSADSR